MPVKPFDYSYPEDLVALQPQEPCRILSANVCAEINKEQLFSQFNAGDVLVINNSKVEKRRVLNKKGLEILFLENSIDEPLQWQVLFPARGLKLGDSISLPGGLIATLIEKGIPQRIQLDQVLAADYFEKVAELALPPYIQAARGERRNWEKDESWYQTAWAKHMGSVASPTASLHFTNQDLEFLKAQGVHIEEVTLHVGAGTFLPVRTENLEDHKMHSEIAEISKTVVERIQAQQKQGARIWALGTTACRTVESWANNKLKFHQANQSYQGPTDLFIYPGYEWKVITGLLTNFHQPKTTLLALVESFSSREQLAEVYSFAIENKFRLFSYGDLSVWTR